MNRPPNDEKKLSLHRAWVGKFTVPGQDYLAILTISQVRTAKPYCFECSVRNGWVDIDSTGIGSRFEFESNTNSPFNSNPFQSLCIGISRINNDITTLVNLCEPFEVLLNIAGFALLN
jgi:hypothetical protein